MPKITAAITKHVIYLYMIIILSCPQMTFIHMTMASILKFYFGDQLDISSHFLEFQKKFVAKAL